MLELVDAARKYPQSAYAGLQKSLQHKWAFLQRVLPDIGDHFEMIEEAKRSLMFFFQLFFLANNLSKRTIIVVSSLTALPVRLAGLGLPNPTKSSAANYEASEHPCVLTSNTISTGEISFQPADHVSTDQDVLAELCPHREETYKFTMPYIFFLLFQTLTARALVELEKPVSGYLVCHLLLVEPNLVAMNFATHFNFAMVEPLLTFPKNVMDVARGSWLELVVSSFNVTHDEINQELGNYFPAWP